MERTPIHEPEGGGGAAPPPILRCEGVCKTYTSQDGAAVTAVQDVSFQLDPGEFLSILGPSGCGKTTLMKMCTGLVSTTAGVIDYKGSGRPVTPGTYGMVFQNAALLPWRSVLDNVLVPSIVLRHDLKAAEVRARELLGLMGLEGFEDKLPTELSGGMQQRVAIARGLVHDPDVLFMDEPFGALDAMTREEMNMLLQQVHLDQRKTVVFVTHSISEAILLSDRVLVLSSSPGRMVADITVPFDRPRTVTDSLGEDFRRMEVEIRDLLRPDETRGAA